MIGGTVLAPAASPVDRLAGEPHTMRPLSAILVLMAGCALPLFTAWAQRQPAVPEKELIAVLDLGGVEATNGEVGR